MSDLEREKMASAVWSDFHDNMLVWYEDKAKAFPVRRGHKPHDFCDRMEEWFSMQWFGHGCYKHECCLPCAMNCEQIDAIRSFCGPNGYTMFRVWCVQHGVKLK